MAKKSGGGHGIIGFFLGFIMCLILEAAVIFGFGYWAYTTSLEKLFNFLGVDNTTTEEGETKYVYVDTSVVSSLEDLISQLSSVADKGSDMTLADLDFLPIISTTVDDIYSVLADALGISVEEVEEILDKDGLMNTPLSDLGDYVMDCVDNIKVSTILNIAVDDWEENSMYLALAYGTQAGTVEVNGTVYYLCYDTFECDDTDENDIKYYRTEDSALFNQSVDYIYKGATANKVYYYVDGGIAYIVTRDKDSGEYTNEGVEYNLYDSSIATVSGGYYMDGDEIVLIGQERTLGDVLANDGIESILYDFYISDLGITSEDELVSTLLDSLADVSLGELLYEDIDLSALLDDILVTDLLASDDELIASVFEGISLGDLLSEDFDFEGLINDIYVGDFLEADPDNAIMSYIGYSVTGLTAGNGTITYNGEDLTYSYTATLHLYDENDNETTYEAYVTVDSEGYINGVYYLDATTGNYEYYGGVTIGEISAQADRLTTSVLIKDIIDLSDTDSAVADELGEYTIDNISTFLDELTLADAIGKVELDTDSSTIMMYVVYGITELTESNGEYTATYHSYTGDESGIADGATVYVKVENGYITGVYQNADYTGEMGTLVNDVNARMDGIMEVLTLADVITDVSVGGDSSTIMMYVVYGISDLTESNGEYTATYHTYDGDSITGLTFNADGEATVYVTVENGYITGVYKNANYTGEIGTPISDINARMNGLMEVLYLSDVMSDVTTGDDSSAIMMYLVYGISGISDNYIDTVQVDGIDYNVYTAKYNSLGTDDNYNDYGGETVYVFVDGSDTIYAVYADSAYTIKIKGTLVNDVSARMDGLMDDMPIGELVPSLADAQSPIAEKLETVTINGLGTFLDSLTLADVMDDISVTDDESAVILEYLVYGLTDVTYYDVYDNVYDLYTAMYNPVDGSEPYGVYVLVERTTGIISGIYELTDTSFTNDVSDEKATLVNDVNERMNGIMGILTIADVMDDVSAEDSAIIDYVVYGLTEVAYDSGYNSSYDLYTAIYNTYDDSQYSTDEAIDYNKEIVYLLVDKNTKNIYRIYKEATCTTDITSKLATPVNNVSDRIDGLMNDLTIGEITDLGTSTIAQKLSGYKINQLSEFLDNLTLADAIGEVEVSEETSSTIMMYIVYGISDLVDENDTVTIDGTTYNVYSATYHAYNTDDPAYSYDGLSVYVLVYDNKITAVYTDDTRATAIGTPVDKISERMDGIMDVLSLADVMDEVSVTSESHAIMDYLVYGLTDVTATTETVNGYTRYTAKYNPLSGTAYDVNVLVDNDGNIYGIYDTSDDTYSTDISATLATPVVNVNDRMNGLMGTITIGELMDTSGSTFLSALADSTISDLEQNIENLAMQEVFYSDIYEQTAASADSYVTDPVENSYVTESVESYYRVVYESIESESGTYYVYSASTYDSNNTLISAGTLTSTSDPTKIADALDNGTLYWVADGDTTYYQVVEFKPEYLYFDSTLTYVEYEAELDDNGDTVLDADGNTVYVRGHITDYTVYSAEHSGILYTYGTPTGTWYFMLYSTYTVGSDSYHVEHVYSVDEIEALMENATENIGNATLNDLYDSNILEHNASVVSNLQLEISADIMNSALNTNKYTDSVTLGELNIDQALSVLVKIASTYEDLLTQYNNLLASYNALIGSQTP